MFLEGVKKKIKTQFCCTLYKEIVFLLFFERVKKMNKRITILLFNFFRPKNRTTLLLPVSLFFFLYKNKSNDGGAREPRQRVVMVLWCLDTVVRMCSGGWDDEGSRASKSEVGNSARH